MRCQEGGGEWVQIGLGLTEFKIATQYNFVHFQPHFVSPSVFSLYTRTARIAYRSSFLKTGCWGEPIDTPSSWFGTPSALPWYR